jgi:uncharacterized protein YhfF
VSPWAVLVAGGTPRPSVSKNVRVTDETRPEAFDPALFDPGEADSANADRAAAVLEFWESARVRAGVLGIEVVTGLGNAASVPPPAWSFGDNSALADQLLDLVLTGTKTATSSLVAEYDAETEPMPKAGDLSILLDGAGAPRALIRTTWVEVVPFGEVDEEFAAAEGEDDRTLASWRAEHEKFWNRNLPDGIELGPGTEVVCERFEVLYPQG